MQKIKSLIFDIKNAKYFIFAALLIVYFWGLGAYPLMRPDEGRYADIPRIMIEQGDFITPKLNYVLYFEKPVLHYWLTAGSFMVFGQNEFAARFFPALFGVLGVFATWLFARRFFDEETANISAVILGTSALYFAISRVNIIDMTLSFFITLSLFSFYFYFRGNKKIWLYIFYAALALAVLAKGLVGMVLPAGVIFWFMVFTRRWDIIKKLLSPAGLLLFFAISVPWFYLVCKRNPEFFRFFFIQEHFLRYTTKLHDRYEPWWYFLPVIMAGFFPWIAQFFAALKDMLGKKEEILYLTIWAAVVLVFFSISSSKLIPYIIPLMPPLAVIMGGNIKRNLLSGKKIFIFFNGFNTLVAAALVIAALLIFGGIIPVKKLDEILLYKTVIIRVIVLTVVFAVLGWLLLKNKKSWLISHCVYAFLFLALVNPGFVIIGNRRSVKPATDKMLKYLQPRDIVVTYDGYDQGIAPYLKRRIVITGWENELSFGNSHDLNSGFYYKRGDEAQLFERELSPDQKMYFMVWHNRRGAFENMSAGRAEYVEAAGERGYHIYVRK